MVKERSEIPMEDRWNVEALYPSKEKWEEDVKKWGREGQKPHWPELLMFKGKMKEGASVIRTLLDQCFLIDRHLSKLFTYAHLKHDEDVAEDENKKAYGRALTLLHDFREETSWMEPEFLEMPEPLLQECLRSEKLKDYKVYLERIVRMKPHTLSADKEELLALADKALEAPSKAFSSFNNADLKFPPVQDSQGQEHELTHGKFLFYLRGKDRRLRESAFKMIHLSYIKYENTLCELISGLVQKHVFDMRARNYSSCLEAALFPYQIDLSVYTSLIQAVRSQLPSLHKYLALRKKLLKVDELHLYDLHVPLVADVEMSMDYLSAEKLVIEATAALGEKYQNTLADGLQKGRWVDRYENNRKRSGAYSSGCYDSMPYILMNYQGTFSDVTTLAHEAGHSMHSYFSNHNQPYHYSHYPIFVAEVASTFNEELLFRKMLEKTNDKQKKCYLINQKIDDIRSTLFRQTMFAEFELQIHSWGEQGIPFTPAMLKEAYRTLNREYFGKDVIIDEYIDIEWSRIPHFYYNFYVYQYATGISAAHALVEKVFKEGEKAKERYLKFLSSGSSEYPLDLLLHAGVDMRTSTPVEATIRHFDDLVDELDHLMQ
jgi:oligoendopeptidase F